MEERNEKSLTERNRSSLSFSFFSHFPAVASATDISSSATSAEPDKKYLACDRFLPTVSVNRLAGGKRGSSAAPAQSALGGIGGVAAPPVAEVPAAAVPWYPTPAPAPPAVAKGGPGETEGMGALAAGAASCGAGGVGEEALLAPPLAAATAAAASAASAAAAASPGT